MNRILLTAALALGFAGAANAQSTATVNQTGDGHDATLVQSMASSATVNQESSGGTVGNTVLLTQSASSALINQTGNGNRVEGETAGSSATQSGGSSVTVTQVSLPDHNPFPGSRAIVEQQDGAMGSIDQNSTGGPGGVARLRQDGASTGTITQINGSAHSGYIYQVGDNNEGTITQEGNGSNSRLYTFGDRNIYSSDQQGTSHVVFAQARGNDNRLTVEQDGAFSGQTVSIRTDGDDNRATITQNHGLMDGGAASDNSVVLYVTGDNNQADIIQSGENNQVIGTSGTTANWPISGAFGQSGNGNVLDVEQTGSFNVVMGSQANGSTATVDQTGMSNTASVTQN